MAKIKSLEPAMVEDMIKKSVVLIDVRREDEWNYTGIIPSSNLLTFFDGYGNYDIDKWMGEFTKLVKSKNQAFVLICAHANRTKTIGNFLIEQGYVNATELEGGMAKWLRERKKTIRYK